MITGGGNRGDQRLAVVENRAGENSLLLEAMEEQEEESGALLFARALEDRCELRLGGAVPLAESPQGLSEPVGELRQLETPEYGEQQRRAAFLHNRDAGYEGEGHLLRRNTSLEMWCH